MWPRGWGGSLGIFKGRTLFNNIFAMNWAAFGPWLLDLQVDSCSENGQKAGTVVWFEEFGLLVFPKISISTGWKVAGRMIWKLDDSLSDSQ